MVLRLKEEVTEPQACCLFIVPYAGHKYGLLLIHHIYIYIYDINIHTYDASLWRPFLKTKQKHYCDVTNIPCN